MISESLGRLVSSPAGFLLRPSLVTWSPNIHISIRNPANAGKLSDQLYYLRPRTRKQRVFKREVPPSLRL
eukprot:9170320-Pyramimonas_sp.AAC.1